MRPRTVPDESTVSLKASAPIDGANSSLMTLTLSAAHRASLRRIVENAGSSAYAKCFFLGRFGPHPENNTSTCYRAGQFGLAQDTENFRAERIVPAPLPGNLRATAPTGIDDRP
jgi:hypothetical protein